METNNKLVTLAIASAITEGTWYLHGFGLPVVASLASDASLTITALAFWQVRGYFKEIVKEQMNGIIREISDNV